MRKIWFAMLLLSFAPRSLAYCNTRPRLVCAEYSNSKLVVVAKLMRIEHIPPRNEKELDGFLYTLAPVSMLKGDVGQTFEVYEENSSGRAPFSWANNETYLLFLNRNPDGTWWLYGCGNSAPLKAARYALRAIESMKARKGGLIHGLVRGDFAPYWERLSVDVRGDRKSYHAVTDKDGLFKIHVPAGHYEVRVIKEGSRFQIDRINSFEDPDNLEIEDGGCAQVQFEPHAAR